ncbi:hypothetical protein GCM10008090_30850 [Arenicella chitinivorans]|uniref:Uncharacterized protein n=1 Tax=Arenicella chitinivorans TaxID=1329800 RepID=A0A918VSJ6_9GAMM|nr:hypothetical protein [Arenicella chitinivorans]GHA18983.1 hypothetical protein GCM10008090_30850 [Arenicella chitinivorans]
MKTEDQKNVFAELQKNRKTRGKGLASPPKISNEVANTRLPEQSEAIPLKTQKPRRTYRVSTYISEDAGEVLDQLTLAIKRKEGKKPKIAEVLERSLSALNKQLLDNQE